MNEISSHTEVLRRLENVVVARDQSAGSDGKQCDWSEDGSAVETVRYCGDPITAAYTGLLQR